MLELYVGCIGVLRFDAVWTWRSGFTVHFDDMIFPVYGFHEVVASGYPSTNSF
jgi:hypothetical protein